MSANVKLYYMLFFFQAVQGVSAINSSVRFLSLALPQFVATIIAGGLATKTGHYIPVMVTGQVVCTVGSALLITLRERTSIVAWAAYMVLAGFGDGMCTNIPYTAVQAMLQNPDDVFIGNGITTFGTLAGGAIGVAIGETLLMNSLQASPIRSSLSALEQPFSEIGAANSRDPAINPDMLSALRQAWAEAVSSTNIFATATIALSIPIALCMQWRNLKKIASQPANERITLEPGKDGAEVTMNQIGEACDNGTDKASTAKGKTGQEGKVRLTQSNM